ncbi:MAG: hypothetical protein QOI86_811, partial [Actinomycetota bacterium]|nr:hypothetical protein [Actinomycetota bacterium]
MKVFGVRPRGLALAAIAAVTVVPLAASAASAAPAAPTAYTVYGSAQPLSWAGSSSPVADLHVPFVSGKTNNFAVANSYADLANPDENNHTLSGDTVNGLTCTGYDDKLCKDPFNAVAQANHRGGVNGYHAEQSAFFTGKDGHFPGNIRAMTDCGGNCGGQLVRSVGNASGPAGAIPGYVSIGQSLASHELSIDDKGRLVSSTRSQLDNVSIGPKNEVHFSKLVTTALALGAGAENTKDGRADLQISDFFILDNPVELTRAGLRLANGGPSEQEAYDGAKVLLQKLKDRGITLELPNFDAQLVKTPDHVTVDTQGLRVRFEQTVGSVQAGLSNPLELGHATAVVVALNIDGKTDVTQDKNGGVTVKTTPSTSAPVVAPPSSRGPGGGTPSSNLKGAGSAAGATHGTSPSSNNGKGTPVTATPAPSNPTTPAATGGESATAQPTDPTQATGPDVAAPPENPNLNALPSMKDVERNLGLRGAHSVSRAFG